jgi:hypothetical protein
MPRLHLGGYAAHADDVGLGVGVEVVVPVVVAGADVAVFKVARPPGEVWYVPQEVVVEKVIILRGHPNLWDLQYEACNNKIK